MNERTQAGRRGTVVLGLGNPLLTDDGLGLAALARLRDGWAFADDVQLVDGGTWGMALLPTLEDAARVLLLDAIDTASPPGTLVRLTGDAIPRALALKVSPHQIDLREVLAVLAFRGTTPPELVALGVQPATMETAPGYLSPAIAARVGDLVTAALAQLALWGHQAVQRPAGSCVVAGLAGEPLDPLGAALAACGGPLLPTGLVGGAFARTAFPEGAFADGAFSERALAGAPLAAR